MKYYRESSHYSPAAGDLVLGRIFDYHSSGHEVLNDFGMLVTSTNIEAHLTHIRTEREQYRLTHPEDVAEIEELARAATSSKHCRK